MIIAKMNNTLDWDDYRIILQITDAGSLAKAASLAGLSHPTMFRRINAIEERLGVRLFDRFRTGYRPTLAGEALVATAREIAELATRRAGELIIITSRHQSFEAYASSLSNAEINECVQINSFRGFLDNLKIGRNTYIGGNLEVYGYNGDLVINEKLNFSNLSKIKSLASSFKI